MAVSTIDPNGLNIGQIGGTRNLIFNGSMAVAQRGTSFTNVGTSSAAYTLDRWVVRNATDAAGNTTQDTSVPSTNEFSYSLKYDVTTADTSIAAGQVLSIQYRLEGYTVAPLGLGKSGTRSFTISFWHKHTKTGTYCVGFTNSAGNRSYAAEYTQSVSDTWEFSTVTATVDTTGTWDSTTGVGMRVYFTVACGTDFHGTANVWSGDNTFATSNQVNALDSTSNNFQITGVQFEVGDTATPFEHRSYGQELALCQRYYEVCHGSTRANQYGGFIGCGVQFKQTKRAAPTLTAPVGGNNDGVSFQAYVTAGYGDYQKTAAHPQWAAPSGGHTYGFEITADAEL